MRAELKSDTFNELRRDGSVRRHPIRYSTMLAMKNMEVLERGGKKIVIKKRPKK